jgi:hypothetical protein
MLQARNARAASRAAQPHSPPAVRTPTAIPTAPWLSPFYAPQGKRQSLGCETPAGRRPAAPLRVLASFTGVQLARSFSAELPERLQVRTPNTRLSLGMQTRYGMGRQAEFGRALPVERYTVFGFHGGFTAPLSPCQCPHPPSLPPTPGGAAQPNTLTVTVVNGQRLRVELPASATLADLQARVHLLTGARAGTEMGHCLEGCLACRQASHSAFRRGPQPARRLRARIRVPPPPPFRPPQACRPASRRLCTAAATSRPYPPPRG